MLDKYNRKIDYLRISLTERCNLRCVYCMPECGIEKRLHRETLTYEEILKLLNVFNKLGIEKIKITGGEPLVRKDVVDFIHSVKNNTGIKNVSMTTNAILLNKYLDQLIEIGLGGINISVDSLNTETFKNITRGGSLEEVLGAIKFLIKKGYKNLKINTVLIKGINDKEIINFAEFVKENPINLRFIELMPIGQAQNYCGIKRETIIDELVKNFGKYNIVKEKLGNGPADYIHFDGFAGNIGFIDAINHKFCSSCNRIRIDSSGFIRLCLQYEDGIDSREFLDGKMSEEEFIELLKLRIFDKPFENNFNIKSVDSINMNQIGG